MRFYFASALICTLCVVVIAEPPKGDHPMNPEAMKQFEECKKEFNVQDQQLKDGTVDKCFFKCIETKMGIMDNNGQFTLENFKKMHPQAPAEFIRHIEECVASSKTNEACETAKKFHVCMKPNGQS